MRTRALVRVAAVLCASGCAPAEMAAAQAQGVGHRATDGHVSEWRSAGGGRYVLVLDGKETSLTSHRPSGDLGTAADGALVFVYGDGKGVVAFDPATGDSRRMVTRAGVEAPAISRGTVAYVTGRRIVFRAPGGRTRSVPVPVYAQPAPDDLALRVDGLDLAGGVYAITTDEFSEDETGTGVNTIWFGRVGERPEPIVRAINSYQQSGDFTAPVITSSWVYAGFNHSSDAYSTLVRVSPARRIGQSVALGRRFSSDQSGEGPAVDSMARHGDAFFVEWSGQIGDEFRTGVDIVSQPRWRNGTRDARVLKR